MQLPGHWRSLKLCRVPDVWHSAKFQTSPSAGRLALGKVPVPRPIRPSRSSRSPVPFVPFARPVSTFFAECGLAHGKSLPSAREKGLGKVGFAGR